MKKDKITAYITATISSLLFLLISFFFFCPAINIKNVGLWILIIITSVLFVCIERTMIGAKNSFWASLKGINQNKNTFEAVFPDLKKSNKTDKKGFFSNHYLYPMILILIFLSLMLFSTPFFNANAYSEILTVTDSDFTTDIAESLGTDSIALMDTASAQMLGDREIGSLSDVVSQFNVSDSYTQIDYKGKPIKVAALDYAGFFKWVNNKGNGIKGYVTVDPVSMSASFKECEGMKITPSAYLLQNAYRYLWFKYPTLMLDNLHFEIDEQGNPYYMHRF